jgi:ABC-2 type transport system permease protein
VINAIPVSKDGSRTVPNASQHNVPAWTIFAMFFVVMSLGSGIVREKQSGSFMRLKTLPTNYLVAMFSKQITYLGVTMIQAALIFSIGAWLFPYIICRHCICLRISRVYSLFLCFADGAR